MIAEFSEGRSAGDLTEMEGGRKGYSIIDYDTHILCTHTHMVHTSTDTTYKIHTGTNYTEVMLS